MPRWHGFSSSKDVKKHRYDFPAAEDIGPKIGERTRVAHAPKELEIKGNDKCTRVHCGILSGANIHASAAERALFDPRHLQRLMTLGAANPLDGSRMANRRRLSLDSHRRLLSALLPRLRSSGKGVVSHKAGHY